MLLISRGADAANAVTTGEDMPQIVVRFMDDEIMEGEAPDLNFDQPDFVLRVADPTSNNEHALIPLGSVKRISMSNAPVDDELRRRAIRKVAIRFQDGEVLKGYLNGSLQHGRYGLTVDLFSMDRTRKETIGIPYSAIKALFYLKSWDSRPPEFGGESDTYLEQRLSSPLVDLLGGMNQLARMRDQGTITEEEFQRKRRQILDNM